MKRRSKYLIAAAVVLVAAVVALADYSTFRSVSVCTDCGEILSETEWQIPFTRHTYWTTRSVRESPVSRVVLRQGLASAGEHHWSLAAGNGNGVMCALGEGEYAWNNVQRQYIADFLDTACNCGERQFAAEWLLLILNEPGARTIAIAIPSELQPGGLQTQAEFDRWWGTQKGDVGEFAKFPIPQLSGGAASTVSSPR